jgi:hypothetical protein
MSSVRRLPRAALCALATGAAARATGGLPLPAARGSAARGEAACARPHPPWPPRAPRGDDPHHTRRCRRRGEAARIRHRRRRRGRLRPSLPEEELTSMPSMVWGRRNEKKKWWAVGEWWRYLRWAALHSYGGE